MESYLSLQNGRLFVVYPCFVEDLFAKGGWTAPCKMAVDFFTTKTNNIICQLTFLSTAYYISTCRGLRRFFDFHVAAIPGLAELSMNCFEERKLTNLSRSIILMQQISIVFRSQIIQFIAFLTMQ